jgi:hypothetical protein
MSIRSMQTPESGASGTRAVFPFCRASLRAGLAPSLRTTLRAEALAGWWRGLTAAQRRLVLFGLFTFATGVLHIGVWLAAGAPSLVGPVTWRKPITFGLSIAVAAWSLAWVVRFLPSGRGLTWTSRAVVWLTMAELGLIDMQQWRGVASHFNNATTFDVFVFSAMGLIIILVAIIIGLWTWQLVTRGVADGRPERLLAARAGMLLMTAGNALGLFLAVWGSGVQTQTGHLPGVFGAAGNVKLTHAVALHGVQALPLLAVLLGAAIADAHRAVRLMRVGVAGYSALLAFVLLQAFSGRAPLDVTSLSAVLLAAAIGGLAWPALHVARAALGGRDAGSGSNGARPTAVRS